MAQGELLLSMPVLLVNDELTVQSAGGRATRALAQELRDRGARVVQATSEDDGSHLGYLRALQAWDRRFPCFGHDTHGVENGNGTYYVRCLT